MSQKKRNGGSGGQPATTSRFRSQITPNFDAFPVVGNSNGVVRETNPPSPNGGTPVQIDGANAHGRNLTGVHTDRNATRAAPVGSLPFNHVAVPVPLPRQSSAYRSTWAYTSAPSLYPIIMPPPLYTIPPPYSDVIMVRPYIITPPPYPAISTGVSGNPLFQANPHVDQHTSG